MIFVAALAFLMMIFNIQLERQNTLLIKYAGGNDAANHNSYACFAFVFHPDP